MLNYDTPSRYAFLYLVQVFSTTKDSENYQRQNKYLSRISCARSSEAQCAYFLGDCASPVLSAFWFRGMFPDICLTMSSQLPYQVVFSFLQPHVVHLNGTYRENGNAASVRTSFAPALLHRLPPSFTFSLSRKLFRRRLEVASLELHVAQQPHLKLELMSPTVFGMGSIDSLQTQVDPLKPPSTSGMQFGTTHKTFGLHFESIVPKLFGEWGITFAELALRFKVGFEYGFAGFNWVFTGSWSNKTTELSVVTHFSGIGVVSELELVFLLYQWISTELSTLLALPTWSNDFLYRSCQHWNPDLHCYSTHWCSRQLLWYLVTILSSNPADVCNAQRKRIPFVCETQTANLFNVTCDVTEPSHIRASRQALEEESEMHRQRDAITGLLKDSARRSQQAEISKGGGYILIFQYDFFFD